jgi:hypothetical protein
MPAKKSTRRAERRRAPRADARLSMRVEGRHDDAGPAHIVTESQNISASGVYCECSQYLAPASRVALTIILPRVPGGRTAKELLKCDGIVVRCEPSGRRSERHYQLACMFSALAESLRQRIEEFVTWRNLQSLRAAANAVAPARRKAARKAPAAPRRASRTPRATTPRRRTVH